MGDKPDPEYVLVPRQALEDLIEDVDAIARLMQDMVYCRLMQKLRPIKDALIDGQEASDER